MGISEIYDAMEGEIVARGCFIVDISISKDNDIEITIESEESSVELEDCVELSRIFGEIHLQSLPQDLTSLSAP